MKLRQRPEWSKAWNAICIIWGLDLILVFCSCLGTFFHPRDILSHVSVPCCLPTIAWGIHQNHRGRISSGVASEVRMIKIVQKASCSMWGLDLILVFCSCLETFFHPRDILNHLCLDIHQNHFGLNLPSCCCLGPLPKPKRPHFVWCVGCLRQRPAFCFLAEDFSSLFLHFFVSSLEIPFGKQVYNSYLHKIRNSTWQIALLLFNCTKTLFPFWGIKHQKVSAQ